MSSSDFFAWADHKLPLWFFELDLQKVVIAAAAALALAILVLCGRGIGHWVGQRQRAARSEWLHPVTEDSGGVFVLTHGLNITARSLEPLADAVTEAEGYGQYGVYVYDYPNGILSNASPENLATILADDLRRELSVVRPDQEIILVGHSLGGLLLRRAYLDDVKEHLNDPTHPTYSSSWGARVSRIVLLVAPNRGSSMAELSFLFRWFGYYPARIFRVAGLSRDLFRGSRFIVNLRLEWIRVFPKLLRIPAVAQFVGEGDAVVAPDDSTDIDSLPNAVTELLPRVAHNEIVDDKACHVKIRRFLERSTAERQSRESSDSTAAEGVIKVLVMHGIRDHGERFQQQIKPSLDSAIQALGREPMVHAPRYRYFSALDFLLPWSRELRVSKFTDEYGVLLARPPHDAPVHFVGHSFGTYQLGVALEEYERIAIGRVYVAGCVLREDFQWHKHLGPDDAPPASPARRVQGLCNTAAVKDWPVGLLCAGVRFLHLSPWIGTGGYNGFTFASGRFSELKYYTGGHGSAIDGKDDLTTITDWILDQTTDPETGKVADGFDAGKARARLKGKHFSTSRDSPVPTIFRVLAPLIAVTVLALLILPWLAVNGVIGLSIGTAVVLGLILRYI